MARTLIVAALITSFLAGSCWRDSSDAASADAGCVGEKSGLCDHGKLHSSSIQIAPDKNVASSVKETVGGELEVVEQKFVGFLQDPLASPFILGGLSLVVLSCIAGLVLACWRNFTAERSEFENARREGRQVDNGTVLVCICKDGEIAEIMTAPGSNESLGIVTLGEKRIAAGPVEELEGSLLVPIQPSGVVNINYFKEERALHVVAGTILVCKREDTGVAYIFESVSSRIAVTKVLNGERVVARRGAQWSPYGTMMVPVRPSGAVELSFFEPAEGLAEDATEAWLRGELEGAAEVDEKLKDLRAQKMQILLEEAARKRKLESIKQAMLDHEAELLGMSGPTDEEVKKRSDEALNNANKATQRGVLMAVAYAAPLITQSQKIYQSIETKMQMCREKGENLIVNEAKLLSKEVQQVMGFDDLTDVDISSINEIDIPTVACILASAFAPAQLNLLYAINRAFFACSLVFLLLDLIVAIFDWHTPCLGKPVEIPPNPSFKQMVLVWWADASDNHIYLWFLADSVVHLFCLLVRLPVIFNVRARLDILERLRGQPRDVLYQDELEQDAAGLAHEDIALVLKRLLEYYMTTGFATLQQLDSVLRSYWVYLANSSIVFDVVWITYGTFLVWNTPWFECADIGIIILRIRSTIFLMLLAFYMLQLGLFCMGQLMQSDNFSVQVIQVGDKIDNAMQLGLPLFKAIFHALVVRHASDMVAIQVNIHKLEKQRLLQKQTKRMAQFEEIRRSLESSDLAIESLEYQNAMHSRAFKDHAAIQEEVNRMKTQYKEESFRFSKKVTDRAVSATKQAQVKIEEWQQGEGPSMVAAMQGETLTLAASMLNQADSLRNSLDGAQELNVVPANVVEESRAVTERTPESISQSITQAELSAGGSSSEIAPPLGPSQGNADLAAGGSSASLPRRLSQPDEGAGR